MNNNARPTVYFSAYPLKAFIGNTSNPDSTGISNTPSLKKNAKPAIRLFPMVNPYLQVFRITPILNGKIPNDIELSDKSWFNHYE
jgi:hypothetical protein